MNFFNRSLLHTDNIVINFVEVGLRADGKDKVFPVGTGDGIFLLIELYKVEGNNIVFLNFTLFLNHHGVLLAHFLNLFVNIGLSYLHSRNLCGELFIRGKFKEGENIIGDSKL